VDLVGNEIAAPDRSGPAMTVEAYYLASKTYQCHLSV
jgi:hypothetical protein